VVAAAAIGESTPRPIATSPTAATPDRLDRLTAPAIAPRFRPTAAAKAPNLRAVSGRHASHSGTKVCRYNTQGDSDVISMPAGFHRHLVGLEK